MRVKYYFPGILWALIIAVLTGIPGNFIPPVADWVSLFSPDKIVHIGMFGVFTCLMLWGKQKQAVPKSSSNSNFWIIGLALVLAMATELMQKYLVINRNGNVYDFIADAVGIAAGYILFRYFRAKKMRKSPPV